MSQSKLFTDWAVKLHTKTAQAGGAVHVPGIQDVSLDPQLQTVVRGGDGSAYNTHGSLASGSPSARFTTLALKTLLDQCGVTGMLVDADGTHPGVVLFGQKFAAGGMRQAAASGDHISLTLANGLAVPRTLRADHQGDATLAIEVFAIKSGDTDPVEPSAAASLDADTYPSISAVWTIGKVVFDSTTIAGVRRLECDFGLQVLTESADDDVYPTLVTIRTIQPTLTLASVHADVLSTLTKHGKEYTAEQVLLYLKKRDEGGRLVADETAEHLKLTLGKCRVDWTYGDDPKTVTMTLTPWYTAGETPVSPVAVNTACAVA